MPKVKNVKQKDAAEIENGRKSTGSNDAAKLITNDIFKETVKADKKQDVSAKSKVEKTREEEKRIASLHPLQRILGETAIRYKDVSENIKLVAEKNADGVIGLYFSASWCPPCRLFTTQLVTTYNELKKNKKKIEIIFISGDDDEESFLEYFKKMPWLAVSFDEQKRKGELVTRYSINGIPRLLLLNPSKGTVFAENGREIILSDPSGKAFPWKNYVPEKPKTEKPTKDIKNKSIEINSDEKMLKVLIDSAKILQEVKDTDRHFKDVVLTPADMEVAERFIKNVTTSLTQEMIKSGLVRQNTSAGFTAQRLKDDDVRSLGVPKSKVESSTKSLGNAKSPTPGASNEKAKSGLTAQNTSAGLIGKVMTDAAAPKSLILPQPKAYSSSASTGNDKSSTSGSSREKAKSDSTTQNTSAGLIVKVKTDAASPKSLVLPKSNAESSTNSTGNAKSPMSWASKEIVKSGLQTSGGLIVEGKANAASRSQGMSQPKAEISTKSPTPGTSKEIELNREKKGKAVLGKIVRKD